MAELHPLILRWVSGRVAPCKAVDKVVAQVSQPAVSQGFQPAEAANANGRSDFGRAADLEIGDTADWEVCATVWPFAATARWATLSAAMGAVPPI